MDIYGALGPAKRACATRWSSFIWTVLALRETSCVLPAPRELSKSDLWSCRATSRISGDTTGWGRRTSGSMPLIRSRTARLDKQCVPKAQAAEVARASRDASPEEGPNPTLQDRTTDLRRRNRRVGGRAGDISPRSTWIPWVSAANVSKSKLNGRR
jgi:hypothetical protein